MKQLLHNCGYLPQLVRSDFVFGTAQGDARVELVAFASYPADSRSACIAVVEGGRKARERIASCHSLGTPVVFVLQQDGVERWSVGSVGQQRDHHVAAEELPRYFAEHKEVLGPESIYRAKTWARLDKQYQLTFVDLGLMPVVEDEIGERVTTLVERAVSGLSGHLKHRKMTIPFGQWLVKTSFWLLAGKILHDKGVPQFFDLDLENPPEVFERVRTHYGAADPITIGGAAEKAALRNVATLFAEHSSLSQLSTEALAYVYENALITKATRIQLGTHSTPSYLVDYIVWQLASWISEIPEAERHVFEPACGHGAFLIAAMRLLRELLPEDTTVEARRRYLRARLHGLEVDSFALEIARLSLTLADIPNPDGWDLITGDMFASNALDTRAKSSTILLANPPFEDFSSSDRSRYSRRQIDVVYLNKTAEMLRRTLLRLPVGGVFGVVVPQSLLHSQNAQELRRLILAEFDLQEICLFPDNVFVFSDMESAILIGRRRGALTNVSHRIRYRRIREENQATFRKTYAATTETHLEQSRLLKEPDYSLRVPDLQEVWEYCGIHRSLAEVADVGQGLIHHGRDLPRGVKITARKREKGFRRGFNHVPGKLQLHELPPAEWLNLTPEAIRRPLAGTVTGTPQVLLNYAPVSRGPWRLKAVIDHKGHPITSRFIALRPRGEQWPLEFVWAILNSPFANAYAYCHMAKRDILVGIMRKLPVPTRRIDVTRIAETARAYLESLQGTESTLWSAKATSQPSLQRELLLQMDAAVLAGYILPPRLERSLLDLFADRRRLGVPFPFDRYFPRDFEPCIPLSIYLSEAFQRSTSEQLIARRPPEIPAGVVKVLDAAAEAFHGGDR